MLSERMRQWVKDSWTPNEESGISLEELAECDNQSVLIFAEEVAQLEAKLLAHIENEGDECPLCNLETKLEQHKQCIRGHRLDRDKCEAENKMLKEKHHPDCNVFIPISQEMPEPSYCTCGYGQLEAENAELRKLLDSKTLNWEEQLRKQRDA